MNTTAVYTTSDQSFHWSNRDTGENGVLDNYRQVNNSLLTIWRRKYFFNFNTHYIKCE